MTCTGKKVLAAAGKVAAGSTQQLSEPELESQGPMFGFGDDTSPALADAILQPQQSEASTTTTASRAVSRGPRSSQDDLEKQGASEVHQEPERTTGKTRSCILP
jgi:hypothetical protein